MEGPGLLGLSPPVANRDSDHFAVGNSESLRGGKVVLLSTFARYTDKVGVRPGNNHRRLPSYHQGEEEHICEEDDTHLPRLYRLLTPLACNKL